MQLYGQSKEWAKLVDVVLELAEFVDDPKQKVKYLSTAAMVCSQNLGDIPRAMECFDQVFELDPDLDEAYLEAISLERRRRNFSAVEKILLRHLDALTARGR